MLPFKLLIELYCTQTFRFNQPASEILSTGTKVLENSSLKILTMEIIAEEENEQIATESIEQSSEEDPLEPFTEVLKLLRSDILPSFAAKIRLQEEPQSDHDCNPQNSSIFATVGAAPLFGSYNILYPIEFNDGVEWIIKVPQRGTPDKFGDYERHALLSEAITMRKLKRETTVPVPRVFAFDSGFEQLGCPFILMEYVDGSVLSDIWHDDSISEEGLEARRTKALDGIAAAMVQLSSYTFAKGGALVYNEKEQLTSIENHQYMDIVATHNAAEDNSGIVQSQVLYQLGPCASTREYFMKHIDRRLEDEDLCDLEWGHLQILRHLVEQLTDQELQQFVLSHPDLNSQNCIVSSEGQLLALIDWDGVKSVPKAIGNIQFPDFLTQDWDPATYICHQVTNNCPQDDPESLTYYREVYADRVAVHLAANNPAVPVTESSVASIQALRQITRQSLIWHNLFNAAVDPLSTHGIVEKVFNEIMQIVDADEELDWDNEADSESSSGSERGSLAKHANGPLGDQDIASSEQVLLEDSKRENEQDLPTKNYDILNSAEVDPARKDIASSDSNNADNQQSAGEEVAATNIGDAIGPNVEEDSKDHRLSFFIFDLYDGKTCQRRLDVLTKGFQQLLQKI